MSKSSRRTRKDLNRIRMEIQAEQELDREQEFNALKEKDRELYQKIKEKSDDDFEKNITYISAGALALSLTYIEKIVSVPDANNVWSLVLAWILLAITLLVNLLSHYISSSFHEKTVDELDTMPPDIVLKNIGQRNRIIKGSNLVAIITLMSGIGLLVFFVSINFINKMSKDKQIPAPTNQTSQDNPTKGRTISKPSSINSGTNSTNVNSTQNTKK